MDKMTLNQQWNFNPPEPIPMNKSLRDPLGLSGLGMSGGGGNGGGGGVNSGGMPRQITKNPLNMLGGLGSDRNGGYSNGSSQQGQGMRGGGFMDNGRGDSGIFSGSNPGGAGGGFNDRGFGKIGDGPGLVGPKLGMNQQQSSAGFSSSGGNNTYGIGAVGGGGSRSSSLGSPGSNFGGGGGNGFNNGNQGNSFFNGMNDRGGGGNRGNMDMGNRMMNGRMDNMGGGGQQRDMMRSNSDLMGSRDMMGSRGDMMGSRGDMMGSRGDMMGSRGDMMGSRGDMMGSRGDMMGGNFGGGMMGGERGNMMGRDMMQRNDMMRNQDMMRGDMMGSRNDMMNSRNDMMGSRNEMRDMMGGQRNNEMRDMMGSRNDMRDMMGSRDMMDRDNFRDVLGGSRDSMMQQRSMSMSNGSHGGMNGGMGQNEHNSFSRSVSYSSNIAGSSSPPGPGGDGMKIGTWNEGRDNGQNSAGSFPAVSNFEIGTFNVNDPGSRSFGNAMNGATQSNNGPIQPGMGIRETGIIEKLLHSYGFIQCCDRQARLFFHFSQFDGNIEHLKIGDPVEFEMTYDRRTGKPIASSVSKIAPEVVMSEERVIGTVTTETKKGTDGNETQGRISYENRGECFFLPFLTPDVEGNVILASGDKVSFQVATVQRSGNLAAKTIRLENPAAPVKYQGVVNSVKDTFGFIERADVVKEIFFHMSEDIIGQEEDNSHIQLGDDVEFIIQTRNGKEVACHLVKLPQGTVIFEDVGVEYFTGQVLKPLDRKPQQSDPLPGRVKYRAPDRSEVESSFGEKDQVGDFSLRHGDWIKFVIATDRRDKLKRATKIELLDESFKVSDERREQGIIQSTKEGFGFLKCVERSEKMFFHFSECLDVNRKLVLGDEMEFTVAPDPQMSGRHLATRIKHLPAGTVKFDIVIAQNILGIVTEEPAAVSWPKSPSKSQECPSKTEASGKIVYELNGLQLSIPLYAGDCDLRNTPKVSDKVQFNINQLKATKETNAVNIRILERANPVAENKNSADTSVTTPPKEKKEAGRLGTPQKGYVAALKDGFGFIETLLHDKEIFFHFSNVEGKAEKLEVGQEVEYSIYSREKGGKVSAEGVKPLSRGSIPKIPSKEDVFNGKVVRPLRSVNPDQSDYCGLIAAKSEEDGKILGHYEFGIASLLNKKELLQEGDPVSFQLSQTEAFALNVKSNKQKLRSHVEAVKGQFGFLSYEQEEGKKLFFHMSEVEGGEVLQVGDEVEFVVVTNQRTRKHSACCVRKLCNAQRPERLISKLKTMNIEEKARGAARVVVTRQPKGPDGTKGFLQRRGKEKSPVVVMDLMEQLTAH